VIRWLRVTWANASLGQNFKLAGVLQTELGRIAKGAERTARPHANAVERGKRRAAPAGVVLTEDDDGEGGLLRGAFHRKRSAPFKRTRFVDAALNNSVGRIAAQAVDVGGESSGGGAAGAHGAILTPPPKAAPIRARRRFELRQFRAAGVVVGTWADVGGAA